MHMQVRLPLRMDKESLTIPANLVADQCIIQVLIAKTHFLMVFSYHDSWLFSIQILGFNILEILNSLE